VAGCPDVFYSDQGADFTSTHIEQIAGDLHMQLVNTIPYKPKGRGKIERLFRTINQMFCPKYNAADKRNPLSLADLDTDFQKWLHGYHNRKHSEIGMTPLSKWLGDNFLPRMPETLEALDLMLLKVEKPHKMFRDGIHLFKRRYSHESLTESVGLKFDVRYDPRDLSSIWIYGTESKFICRATTQGIHPSEQEIKTTISNRQRVKKRLKLEVKGKRSASEDFLQAFNREQVPKSNEESAKKKVRLRKHFHERN